MKLKQLLETFESIIRTVYVHLKPGLKCLSTLVIRFVAQKTPVKASPPARILGDKSKNVFFGYYDITPFSNDESKLLAIRVPLQLKTPTPDIQAEVGWYDISSKNSGYHLIGDTTSWCWQQGCRLQWYPKAGKSHVIYNIVSEGAYKARLQDAESKKVEFEFCMPIYSVSADGSSAATLDFSRLQRLRPGYGYGCLLDSSAESDSPDNNGIWIINLARDKPELIVSLSQLASIQNIAEMDGAQHYINHLCFNPSGKRLMFFHLWTKKGRRWARLYTVGVNGDNLTLLESNLRPSHYTWKNDSELLVTASADGKTVQYVLYNDFSGVKSIFGNGVLVKDGHPSYFSDMESILTDTYPDSLREQSVLMFRPETQKLTELYKVYMPFRFSGEVRCDLHPRLSHSGQTVCIDSVSKNRRVLQLIKVIR